METQSSEHISSPKFSRINSKTSHSTPNDKKDLLLFPSQTPLKTPSSSAPRIIRDRAAAGSVRRFKEAASQSLDSIYDAQEGTDVRSAKRRMNEWLDESEKKNRKHTHVKFGHLIKLFDALDIAVRVLRLKKCQSTFSSLSKSVEALIERAFTNSHLAQMKFLMPEYIEITRTRILDETKSSTNPELRVVLLHSDVGMKLKTIFRSKLEEFSKSHPEMDDVPEALLPYPFSENQVSPILNSPVLKNERSSLSDVLPASHFPPSCRPKIYSIKLENPAEDCDKQRADEDELNSMNCTPLKEVPVLSSPCSNTPGQHSEKSFGSRKLVRSVSRNLFAELAGEDSDPICEEEIVESIVEKERGIGEVEDERMKTIGRLPKLFDRVRDLYLSLNKLILTKDELIHKLMFYEIGFKERGELEEELNLMMKLIPEYISEKILFCGDKIICVDKTASSTYAREQLEIASVSR